jgi:pyruvate/2-oxoglutarate/acetoin dehydrogenase E1 component
MATVMEECFLDLDAPLPRICTKDVAMPVISSLQRAVMVSEEDILKACRDVVMA